MQLDWQKTIEQFRARVCTGGIDLSAVSDLTCWCMMFPDPENYEAVDILLRTWCPEEKIYDRKNKYRDQYQAWEKEGYLESTSGNAIDYDYVRARIVSDAQVVKIDMIAIDRYFQGYEFAMKLNEELGGNQKTEKVIACGMGYRSMAEPMKEIERRLLLKKLNHGGNPILRWMADNVSVAMDPAGNLKPNKATSQGKIDGIITILLALWGLTRLPPPVKIKMPMSI